MATITIEERPTTVHASVTLNGLPMPRSTTLHPGDRIRVGDTILCYTESPKRVDDEVSPEVLRLAERDEAYDVGCPFPTTPERHCPDARHALARSPELVAEAPAMRRLLERVRRVACGNSSVLLLGESGTGKEVLAQAIRANGPRRSKPIVAVNAAALPESVLESELFGHERGAFTGALIRREGVFELASGGTLFLDEIGELPATTQAKLLRVLESREVRRVGGDAPVKVNARIISATNRDLLSEVRAGRFRADLYFRLAVVELEIPPLRERPEDIEPLAKALLDQLGRSHGRRGITLGKSALDALLKYTYPGNIRELRNILEHAVNFAESATIDAADLPPQVRSLRRGPAVDSFPTLQEVERRHVEAALSRSGGNKSRAAVLLGIDRKTLYHKIAVHGITCPGSCGAGQQESLLSDGGDSDSPTSRDVS
jgi:transcriptional regulator with PAS, ATPase and Fis domain